MQVIKIVTFVLVALFALFWAIGLNIGITVLLLAIWATLLWGKW